LSGMADWTGFAGVIIGAAITGGVAIGGEILRGRQESNQDSTERADNRLLASDQFQRESLLALQDAAADLARACGRLHHHDLTEFRRTGTWGGSTVGEELGEAARLGARAVSLYRSRIADAETRDLEAALASGYGRLVAAKDQPAGDAADAAVAHATDQLITRTGELIRSTFRA
jgi:hypothetical protein